ncbi:lipid A deacylase LpxR family protein [Loktanella sp. SALINAS62]|nr:lipid A-modifier LpxR family protein [Loktanella sp. SALINAS62]MBS1300759.1 lipid A deacylase LpxR family protein [Loktanella sp. SALINAS62]
MFADRQAIGNGRLFTNDALADGHDRWRTGSYAFSHLRAPQPFDGALDEFGDVIEYRFRAEIIAPDSRTQGRPYAGLLSAGAHTHFGLGSADARVGADLVVVGPQTGLNDFQEFYHDTFGLQQPLDSPQLNDTVFLDVSGEVRQTYALGDTATLRPFLAGRLGTEDIARVGADLIVGRVGQDDLLVRDVVTGQLYPGAIGSGSGVGFVLGGDIASVSDTQLLPASEGYDASPTRSRARAGVNWQPHPGLSLFYGATYLSREFETQPEGQVVGSVRLNFSF